MKYLVDTNVISEVRHPEGSEVVKSRFRLIDPAELCTSAIVFGELTKGVVALPDGKRKTELVDWLGHFEQEFGDRILPFDRTAASRWGTAVAEAARRGNRISVSDGQIAATALANGLTVITRNVKHFEPMGVSVWDIWKSDEV